MAGLSARVADGWRAYRRTADAKINVVIALQDEPQHVFGKHRTDSVWPPLPPYSRPDSQKMYRNFKLDVIVNDMGYFFFICLLKLIMYNSKPQNQMCD